MESNGQSASSSEIKRIGTAITPKVTHEEEVDVLASASVPGNNIFPPSPPASTSGNALTAPSYVDEPAEMDIDNPDEYSDAFVTQVYNYLSLGYPSIAADYDDELSKISGIPTSELHADDKITTERCSARGYIRLGEKGLDGGVEQNDCARWRALRRYVDDWVRNRDGKKDCDGNVEGLGLFSLGGRRGSWGT